MEKLHKLDCAAFGQVVSKEKNVFTVLAGGDRDDFRGLVLSSVFGLQLRFNDVRAEFFHLSPPFSVQSPEVCLMR